MITPEDEELFRKLKPLYPVLVEAFWIEFHVAEEERQREIREYLLTLALQRLQMTVGEERILLEPPPAPVIGDGEILVGEVIYPGISPYPCRLQRDELLRHVFLLGPTGTGKTTLMLQLLTQLLTAGMPVMVFDFKTNYRVLVPLHPDLVVLTVGNATAPLGLNALQPPQGVPFEEWAGALADILSAAYLLMHGARNILREAFLRAWQEQGEQATFHTAFAILKARFPLTAHRTRTFGWMESAHRALDELTKGGFGQSVNQPDAMPLPDLLQRSIVLELHGLSDDQKRFLALYLLQAILYHRKHSGRKGDTLRHVLVFDESHHIFPQMRQGELDVPSRLAREIREYGEGIIAASQQTDVADSLVANSGIKIILRTDHPKDVLFASKVTNLPEHHFSRLLPGLAILRLPVRHLTPFLVRFPSFPGKNMLVTDEDVRLRFQARFRATPFRATEPVISLNEQEKLLLGDCAQHPGETATERFTRLGWNPRTMHATKNRLLARGFLTTTPVTSPFGRATLFGLTRNGREALVCHGMPLPTSRTGGPVHAYWVRVIARFLKEHGYRVVGEFPLGDGRALDLFASKGGDALFIEVETGHSDIPANIQKVDGLAGRVLFFFTTKALTSQYRGLLGPTHEAISPETFSEIIPK